MIDPALGAAQPVLSYAARLAVVAEAAPPLAVHARVLLDRFGAEALRAGLAPDHAAIARAALALLLVETGAANPALGGWLAAAQSLGAGDAAGLAHNLRRDTAVPGPVRDLVADCLRSVAALRQAPARTRPAGWGGMMAVLLAAWLATALGWALWVEARQGRALERLFQAEALATGLDRDTRFADLGARLDRLAQAAAQVRTGMGRVALRPMAWLGLEDPGARAARVLDQARARQLPPALALAIDRALGAEGKPRAAYDTQRAWAVLSGAMPWQPSWLAGWAADRAAGDPQLAGLAPHLLALRRRPETALPAPDAELLAQSRDLAAEAPEPPRAFLELRRLPETAALPPWHPDQAVPELPDIAERRSGQSITTPIAGLYTAAGWDMATRRGSGLAVEAARTAAVALWPDLPPDPQNDSPDQVLALLQTTTLDIWEGWLSDLRLRSFDDRRRAVLVSGALSRADGPLAALLAEIWRQVGGTDRQRPHALQMAVAVRFGPEIQYVETGGIAQIAALFAQLNVALAAMDTETADAQRRLLSVRDRARSVRALRDAPPLIARLVEDTLAESGAAEANGLTNPLTRAWQTEVLPLCAPLAGRFPFAEGPDADPAAIALLLGPDGAVARFTGTRAAALLDRDTEAWRWKPEARLSGLDPGSAAFLQRALAAGAALAPGNRVTAAALAERGRARIMLGGAGGPLGAAGDTLVMGWPGPDPGAGAEVSFVSDGQAARLAQPGPWGLLRMLAPLRLRERDGGQRFLIDLRTGGARLFLELRFDRAQNPLAARRLIHGLTCPQVL